MSVIVFNFNKKNIVTLYIAMEFFNSDYYGIYFY